MTRNQKRYRLAVWLLVILLAAALAAAGIGGMYMLDHGVYSESWNFFLRNELEPLVSQDCGAVYEFLEDDGKGPRSAENNITAYLSGTNILGAEASRYGQKNGKAIEQWQFGEKEVDPMGPLSFSHTIRETDGTDLVVTVELAPGFPVKDAYRVRYQISRVLYGLRYWIYPIGAVLALGLLLGIWYLVRQGREEEKKPYWGMKIPGDLFLLAAMAAACEIMVLVVDKMRFSSAGNVYLMLGAMAVLAIGALTIRDLVQRRKQGGWYAHTLLHRAAEKVKKTVAMLPIVWKTAIVYGGVSLLALAVMAVCRRLDGGVILVMWAAGNAVLLPAVLAAAMQTKKLRQAGRELAEGNLSYQVDTAGMLPELKAHGKDLNRIGEGMAAAVEQKLRSERMKTELITNVSHDLKTPLTNIINYSDLICQETCDNPKIGEYSQVLNRQSERLKRLIEDLVEASKASTGNLEVELAPCEVGVMLIQVAGEYEERMAQSHLELVTRQPEKPVRIQADGRRLWRVFDNLMTNVCKYSQSGTRVYLTLEENQGNAVISFKNTSREPLDLTAEELMERFVRGDRSRKTEGNGLGLSIARSLTELQNGTMELMVDGDFFKVTLCFPEIDN